MWKFSTVLFISNEFLKWELKYISLLVTIS